MTNSTDPLDINGGGREPGTELTDRLVRRRTDPVGIIDVRRPERHYERTAGWVARRFSMLDQLKSRYGSDESASSGESMVFTSSQRQSPTAPDRAASSPPQIARALAQAVANKTSVAPVAPAAPVEEFRVRRRAIGGALNQGLDQALDQGLDQATVRRKEIPGGREVATVSDAARGDSPPLALAQEPSGFGASVAASLSAQTEPSGIEASPHRAAPAESASGLESPGSPGVSRAAESDSPLPLRVRRKRSETGAEAGALERALPSEHKPTGAANLGGSDAGEPGPPAGRAQAPVAAESVLPLPLRAQRKRETGASGQPSPSMQGSPAAAALGLLPIAAVSRKASTGETADRASEGSGSPGGKTAQAEVESRAPLPLVQRRVADNVRGADGRAPGDSSGPSKQGSPVASAIRAASTGAPSPAMVWRQSAAPELREAAPDMNKSPRAAELLVARQSSTGESAPSNAAPSAQPAPATAPAGGLDLGQIAEHVGRLLSRQLAVERERRGRGR